MIDNSVLLSVCLVLALGGCTGLIGGDQTGTATPAIESTPTQTPSETATTTPTSSPTQTATPEPEPEVTLFTVAEAGNMSRATGDLRTAVTIWNQSSFETDHLKYIDSQTEADVEVVFKPTIDYCEGEFATGTYYWCYDEGADTLEIANRYVDNQTQEYTKRGVGFVAGIDDPEQTQIASEIETNILRSPFLGLGPVNVTIVNRDGEVTPRHRTALNRTIDYWNSNAEKYSDYPATFTFVSSQSDADIVVAMNEDIRRCAEGTDALGCAPILDRTAPASTPITVQVETGFTLEDTTEVMQHEFGHVLGLDHGEEPMPLMSESTAAELARDVQNLNSRSYGFQKSTLGVYIDNESFGDSSDNVRSGVIEAIEWYEEGNAEATPEDFNMVLVDSEAEAELVVRQNRTACSGTYYWCTLPYVTDLDTDDQPEYYSVAYINLRHGSNEKVAYNFAKGAGFVIANAPTSDDAPPKGVSDYEQDDWPE